MSFTHFKKLFNPDYIGAWAFEPKEEKTVTIDFGRVEMVVGADGKKEECAVIHFAERGLKPMILNSTNGKAITKLLGTPYIEEWAGKQIILHVQRVKAFGDVVDAVRVAPRLPPKKPQTAPLQCADCAADLTPFGKMDAAALAEYTKSKYGRILCAECAKKAATGSEDDE